jgi:hypothetical protein|tara:strand:- start:8562 stop:8723 length:162 start_codon:yes stop_codon:yes gene_type:complete
VFEPDPLLNEDYEISEEELRNYAKKTLLEIKHRRPQGFSSVRFLVRLKIIAQD